MFSFPSFKRRTVKAQVLFHRDYLRFQGGHLKVFHYFNHLKNTNLYNPTIYFTEQSIQDKSNPWNSTERLSSWLPAKADIIFLAGLDWQAVLQDKAFLKKQKKIPVINLIQGLSHAEPTDIKYKFLSEPAIRICVSPQVSAAIQSTGHVNGPVFTIPNGVDLDSLPAVLPEEIKDIDLLIVAIKKPELGLALEKSLSGKCGKIINLTHLTPRNKFLNLLSRSKICLCLPHFTEGFYLPALEGMALGAVVVCPDCIGNRAFCSDQKNCFFPRYEQESIIAAVDKAMSLSTIERKKLIQHALLTVDNYSLKNEASQFLDIMSNIKSLW